MPKQFVKVATTGELAPGEMKLVEVEGERILLVNVGGAYYALDEVCTHSDGPLSEGTLDGETVECPWHGSRFNVTTGEVEGPPADESLTVYSVEVEGEDILLGPPVS